MLAGETDAGLRAYEKALELTDTPELRKEVEAARRFAEQISSGPDAETIRDIQNLSTEDQAAAIAGMVEGLRARLETEPNDPEGWTSPPLPKSPKAKQGRKSRYGNIAPNPTRPSR